MTQLAPLNIYRVTVLAQHCTLDIETDAKRKTLCSRIVGARRIIRASFRRSKLPGLGFILASVPLRPYIEVAAGDDIVCRIPAPPPMEAVPEDIPLEVKYEDEHLMIVNKPAGMVVHPSAGHQSGTLVNAVLHHCRLPAMRVVSGGAVTVSYGFTIGVC